MTTALHFRRHLALLAGVSTLAALAAAGPAAAQTAPGETAPAQTAETPDPESPTDILVTGTRVVRDGYQAPTPLTVLNAEDIQNSSPSNNVADFVNQIPSVAGSIRPSNSRLAISSGLSGINALSLRNLDPIRTLEIGRAHV